MFAKLKGCASFLPSQCIDNQYFEKRLDTSDAWIYARTGIKERFFCADHESDLTLATGAAIKALDNAKMSVREIDLTIVATSTPSTALPSLACRLQGEIDLSGCAFDVNAACSGFVAAMEIAQQYIHSKKYQKILIVAVDVSSQILDMTDRSTCVLFGDGAGAVVLEADDEPGILLSHCLSDGKSELIHSKSGSIEMNGREVFKQAISRFDQMASHMAENGFHLSDIDHFIPHQANHRIIENICKKHKIPEHKVVSTIRQYGNTMAASIPMALSYAYDEGRVKSGQLIFFESIGAGMIWGYVLMRV